MVTQRICLVLFLLVTVLPAQFRLREHQGDNFGDLFGTSVAGIGDINGDGVPDYAVGAVGTGSGPLVNSGSVYTYSGANGALIWRVDGAPGQRIGESVSGGKDFDLDGIPDLLVTSLATAEWRGGFGIYSGVTGDSILQVAGTEGAGIFGYSSLAAEDIDADGVPDVIIGRLQGDQIDAFSGLTGSLIYSAPTPGAGLTIAQLGDLDGDSVGDLALAGGGSSVVSGRTGAPLATGLGARLSNTAVPDQDGDGKPELLVAGAVLTFAPTTIARLLASSTGALIWSASPLPPSYSPFLFSPLDNVGVSCCVMGDVDGDAVDDIVVGSPELQANRGALMVVSGATGQTLRIVRGEVNGSFLGARLAAIGDVDGDGMGDVATSASGAYFGRGRCLILTPASPSRRASEIILGDLNCGIPAGTLTLSGTGLLTPGAAATATVALIAGPNFPGLLAFETGLAQNQPMFGCTLYLQTADPALWTQVPFTTDNAGNWSLPFTVPNDQNLVGLPVVVQAAVVGGNGVSLLNGLQLVIGN